MIVYESIDDEIRHHIKRADAPLRVQDGCGAGPLPRTVLQYRDQDQVRKRRQYDDLSEADKERYENDFGKDDGEEASRYLTISMLNC